MNDEQVNEMYTRITPELADEWLKKNTNNRPVREQFVKQLVKKIKNGEWQIETCDAIGFYADRTLANGQHRLKAISLAGVPVYACVKYNIPKEAAVCIDSGKSRTALAYYYTKVCDGKLRITCEGKTIPIKKPRDLYIITTAKNREFK